MLGLVTLVICALFSILVSGMSPKISVRVTGGDVESLVVGAMEVVMHHQLNCHLMMFSSLNSLLLDPLLR